MPTRRFDIFLSNCTSYLVRVDGTIFDFRNGQLRTPTDLVYFALDTGMSYVGEANIDGVEVRPLRV
jgi:hypothetical protein